jgi:catechol 2,3-dioxygenase
VARVHATDRQRVRRSAMMSVMSTRERIHPDTSLGQVELVVGDLDGMASFYEQAIGLAPISRSGNDVRLGSAEGGTLIELAGRPDAPPRPRHSTGLFHVAFLVPSRKELARSVRRVIDAGWNFTGASDHLVSEALYLDDPEGNGIEIYRDRPREEWRYDGGQLAMATLPLDLDSVMAELDEADVQAGADATRVGHVHLQVSQIPPAEAFYEGGLGLDVTTSRYPGALFMSAGGYHHHIGTNTWASANAPAPPAGSRGLRRYTVVVPDAAELGRVAGQMRAAGYELADVDGGVEAVDPSGNHALLTADAAAA